MSCGEGNVARLEIIGESLLFTLGSYLAHRNYFTLQGGWSSIGIKAAKILGR